MVEDEPEEPVWEESEKSVISLWNGPTAGRGATVGVSGGAYVGETGSDSIRASTNETRTSSDATLWVPHVSIALLLVALVVASFVRFHCKYGHKYRKPPAQTPKVWQELCMRELIRQINTSSLPLSATAGSPYSYSSATGLHIDMTSPYVDLISGLGSLLDLEAAARTGHFGSKYCPHHSLNKHSVHYYADSSRRVSFIGGRDAVAPVLDCWSVEGVQIGWGSDDDAVDELKTPKTPVTVLPVWTVSSDYRGEQIQWSGKISNGKTSAYRQASGAVDNMSDMTSLRCPCPAVAAAASAAASAAAAAAYAAVVNAEAATFGSAPATVVDDRREITNIASRKPELDDFPKKAIGITDSVSLQDVFSAGVIPNKLKSDNAKEIQNVVTQIREDTLAKREIIVACRSNGDIQTAISASTTRSIEISLDGECSRHSMESSMASKSDTLRQHPAAGEERSSLAHNSGIRAWFPIGAAVKRPCVLVQRRRKRFYESETTACKPVTSDGQLIEITNVIGSYATSAGNTKDTSVVNKNTSDESRSDIGCGFNGHVGTVASINTVENRITAVDSNKIKGFLRDNDIRKSPVVKPVTFKENGCSSGVFNIQTSRNEVNATELVSGSVTTSWSSRRPAIERPSRLLFLHSKRVRAAVVTDLEGDCLIAPTDEPEGETQAFLDTSSPSSPS